jgi:hypothetical protein
VDGAVGDRFKRVTVFENGISQSRSLASGRGRYSRDYKYFDGLTGLERQILQNQFAVFSDGSFYPACGHALSIEDLRCAREVLALPWRASAEMHQFYPS